MSKIEENLVNWKSIEAKVIAKALEDEAFKTRLMQDPKECIEEEFECKICGDVKINIAEESEASEMTIMLPKVPKLEMSEKLSDKDVDDIVAAGNVGISVSFVTSDLVLVTIVV